MLEIVLGIDNIIFISILVERLPARLRQRARLGGLALAMMTRIALLFSLIWLTHITQPLFTIAGRTFSVRDVVLIAGGLFLIGESVLEIHRAMEGEEEVKPQRSLRGGLAAVIAQIGVIDIVFSLDSVLTAVGLVRELPVMVAAIVAAILVMMSVAGPIGAFIGRHPSVRMLALAFLMLIGVALIGEGLHFEIPKGYIYFAMAFAAAVEAINVRLQRKQGQRRR
ncbi:MAG TPA: TerC family protein [Steroidobacteraceae bacterium]|nr:TerC family protein [Steroidobacteraceae bacterium]